jgi:hypothetical protein
MRQNDSLTNYTAIFVNYHNWVAIQHIAFGKRIAYTLAKLGIINAAQKTIRFLHNDPSWRRLDLLEV